MSAEPSASPATAPAAPSRDAARQKWIDRLDRFASAGLPVSAFCRHEGVSTQAFYYWRQKLAPTQPAATPRPPRLLPVALLPPSGHLELVLPQGAVLRLAPGCDLAFVRSLVAALGESPC